MADTKISALPSATTPVAGTEVLPIVQSSATTKVSIANLTAGRAVSALSLTLSAGNLVVANTYGVDFSASSGAGVISGVLNDYETGTYTITLYDASSGGNASATTATAYYTKIGDLVNVFIAINALTDISTAGMTGVNTLHFSLPFAPAAAGLANGNFTGDTVAFTALTTSVSPYVSGARVALRESISAAGDAAITVNRLTTGVSDIFNLHVCYKA